MIKDSVWMKILRTLNPSDSKVYKAMTKASLAPLINLAAQMDSSLRGVREKRMTRNTPCL